MYTYILSNYKSMRFVIVLFMLATIFTSCSNSKKLGYHIEGMSDSLTTSLPELKAPQSVIQVDDILEIKILGANPETANDFNTKGGSYAGASTSAVNYLVDLNGEIEIYKIGKVKVAGLTKEALKEKLITAISKYLKEANVVIRFINFRFTMLGDIRSPGIFTIPNEKISIIDAVAMAGDFAPSARRNKVRIIRDSSGFRETGVINFTQKTLFTSPYYYLRRNDIIIVEKENKGQPNQVMATVSTIVGIVTSVITLFYLVGKK